MNPIGLYLHVPFCVRKCGYCDFYSVCDLSLADAYTDRLCRDIERLEATADTLYIGGGTPSLLGADRLAKILHTAKHILTPDCEVTVEVNPGDPLERLLPALAESGANRLSIGMQSHCDTVLKKLTRRHNADDVEKAINLARASGFQNISLDVMLGVEGLTLPILKDALDFCRDAQADHVSAYMLKIEEGTPYFASLGSMILPDEDETAEQYLYTCETLQGYGFEQYEISNFAKDGKRSRHNMKYWNLDQYIGIGPAAHSYYKGKRFYYPRDLTRYLNGGEPIDDGSGGDFEEYVMLRLRLSDGLNFADALERHPDQKERLDAIRQAAAPFDKAGLLRCDAERVSLLPKGFLVSNSIISELLL